MPDFRCRCLLLLAAPTIVACARSEGSVTCGINSLVRPLAVKDAFGAGDALAAPPEEAPAAVPVRLVAGPAWRGTVSQDSVGDWHVAIGNQLPATAAVGYGVLVVDFDNAALGVLLYEGRAILGAAHVGLVTLRDTVVPLLGVRVNPATLQDARCPLFPDSLR